MVKAVIFDIGGVLVDNPKNGMFSHYAQTLNVSVDKFEEIFPKYEVAWLKGELSESEFWDKITTDLGVTKPEVESLWLEGFLPVFNRKLDVFSLIKQLKKRGYRVAILSNIEVPIMNHIKKQHWEDFELFVYSCEIGMAKPDKDIYDYTLKNLGVKPEEAVFIDDKPPNVETANNLGIHGRLFTDADELTKQLVNLGVLT